MLGVGVLGCWGGDGQFGASLSLFNGIDVVALVVEMLHSFEGRREIVPADAIFRPECRLVNLWMGRTARDATQVDGFDAESIGCTEDASHVVHRANIV